MKWKLVWWIGWLGWSGVMAQFAPPAGQPGSTAIHKDSAVWVGWAKECQVVRGYLDIQNPSLGQVSAGSPSYAVGSPDNAIVSLGDSGVATLTFEHPITNGPGPDFAVFENGFNDTFLELALVEVSSDGVHFVRFPAISLTDTTTQVGSFGAVDATKIHNLAGKYRVYYGTPFDLEDLKDSANIDLHHITHVRVVDVIGCVSGGCVRSYDSQGRPINDPYPTAFATGGFDLDAVGVIHWDTSFSSTSLPSAKSFKLYPTFFSSGSDGRLFGRASFVPEKVQIFTVQGQVLLEDSPKSKDFVLDVSALPSGVYWVVVAQGDVFYTQKICVAR